METARDWLLNVRSKRRSYLWISGYNGSVPTADIPTIIYYWKSISHAAFLLNKYTRTVSKFNCDVLSILQMGGSVWVWNLLDFDH